MAYTKRQVVVEAYEELGKASYEFDLQPEMMQSGLRRLDAMMARWHDTLGLRIGYSGGKGDGSIDAETEVADWAFEGLYLNLAVRLAPTFGKTVTPETKLAAREALESIRARTILPRTRNIGGGYAGAGSSRWNGGNLSQPSDPLVAGEDGFIFLEGGA